MGLQESRGKITSSMKDLMALWGNTKLVWNDVNAEKIENNVLKMLEQDVRVTASAMDQMAALLASIRQQCD